MQLLSEFNELSVKSVHLTLYRNDIELGKATGFIVKDESTFYLVTNWHVLSGRSPYDGQPHHEQGAVPNLVKMCFMFAPIEGSMTEHAGIQAERLVDEYENNLWIEHPDGRKVDVALLKLENPRSLKADVLDIDKFSEVNLMPEVGMTVFIVGYPFGKGTTSVNIHPYFSFPVWKTGHIASEPSMLYNDNPAVLIDATTREGMSGSPVYIRPISFYRPLDNPNVRRIGDNPVKFLGIYSGRLNIQTGDDSAISSELGLVWNPSVVKEIIAVNQSN